MIPYTPPSTEQLQALREHLGFTSNQMAELASVAAGSQWRKYMGGAAPRDIGLHMLFFIAARLTLSADELRRVAEKMQEIGADVDGEAITKTFPLNE